MTAYTDKEIAAVAWAANAELQALHGDPDPSLPGDPEDAGAHAVTLAGVRAALEGATPEQMHETWMRAREAQGWTHGPRKDSRLKTHPALVPYADLPEHQRVKDRVFAAIVRAMAGQDAPELAAAIDPAKLDLLADWFDVDDLAKGRSGRTEVQEDLRRWAEAIRDARQLPPGLTAVEAVRTAVAEEWQPRVDALRELLDEIGVMAANAPEDGDSFGLLEEIAMRIAAAGVPDSAPGSAAPEQLEAK